MIVDLRLSDTTVAKAQASAAASLAAVLDAAANGEVDPARLRVQCDWIQYAHNFREPVALRQVLRDHYEQSELAFDLRQIDVETVRGLVNRAISTSTVEERVFLEPWSPLPKSCIWRFNALYWSELELWEEVSGTAYEQVLPRGSSGGSDIETTRSLIRELIGLWDELAARRSLPQQLAILELGVGNGNQACSWLDELLRIEHERGSDYYRRVHYLMGDYSAHVLSRARNKVAAHRERTSTLLLDAFNPSESLKFLDKQIFAVYVSNVYDNLPTDEILSLDDELYRVQARAYLPRGAVDLAAKSLNCEPEQVAEIVSRLLMLGPTVLSQASPQHFASRTAAGRFWLEVWGALRLEERYVPLGARDLYEICAGFSGEVLEPLIDGSGDLRLHVSNGAAASLVDTLPLVHPLGSVTCHDLFVTDLSQYRAGFRGPGKYQGSIVNWVNGPVLHAIAARLGFHVSFQPLAGDERRSIVTMTARARE